MRLINKKIVLAVIWLINLYMVSYALEVYGVSNIISSSTPRTFIVALLLLILLGDIVFSRRIKKIELLIAVYCFIVMFSLMICNRFTLSKVGSDLFFPIILSLSIRMADTVDEDTWKKIVGSQALMAVVFLVLFFYGSNTLGLRNGMFLNSCYYSALLLPFILCIHKSFIRNIFTLLLIFPIVMSAKRGAFLSVLIALIVFYVAIRKTEEFRENKRSNTIWLISTFLGIFIILVYVNKTMHVNVWERLLNAVDDGGSGRVDLAKGMLELIYSGNSFQGMLIGHGSFSSSAYLGFSSHNDFLEMIWSYGFLGFACYIAIIGSFFKKTSVLKRHNNTLYAPLLAAIVEFMICSFFSQLVFVPTYVAYLLVFIGVSSYGHIGTQGGKQYENRNSDFS